MGQKGQLFTTQFLNDLSADEKEKVAYDSRVQGLGIRAYPSGKKVFFTRVTLDGKRRKKTIGEYMIGNPPGTINLERAREIAKTEISKTELPKSFLKMKDMINYFDLNYPRKRSEGTIILHSNFSKLCLHEWGDTPINSITRSMISNVYRRYSQEGLYLSSNHIPGPAPAIANRFKSYVSTILSFAVSEGMLSENPALGIMNNPEKSTSKSEDKFKYMKIPEYAAFIEALKTENIKFKALWTFIRTTGCRPGTGSTSPSIKKGVPVIKEGIGAKWEQINLKTGAYKTHIKNRRIHSYKMSSEALSYMTEYWESLNKPTEGLCWPNTNHPSYPMDTRKAWQRVLNKAGIERKLTPHSLRHTYGVIAASKGFSIEQRMEMMGHDSREANEVYSAIFEEDKDDLLDEMHKFLS